MRHKPTSRERIERKARQLGCTSGELVSWLMRPVKQGVRAAMTRKQGSGVLATKP